MRIHPNTSISKSELSYLSIITFLLIFPLLSSAQVAFWQKYFGGSGFDLGQELIVKEDGTILVAAEAFSSDKFMDGNHSSNSDICLFQYSTQEIIFWKKFYGGSGEESISQLIETNESIASILGL
ncbi:MAG: hypothetical protein AAFR66_09220, partial [Bacteroidota bacterium]